MSGTFASVLGAASSIQQIVGLFTGGALSLGDMTFGEFELPERITYGGQQQITTHKLPGGARVLDAMGDDPSAISWSGIFLGLGSEGRRTQLEAIRKSGDPVDLAWSDQTFTVLVADCQYDEGFHQIAYRVSCIVLPDPPDDDDLGDGTTPDTPSAASDAGGSAFDAAGTTLNADDTVGQANLTTAQTAAQSSGAFTTGTATNLNLRAAVSTLTSGLAQAQGVASVAMGAAAIGTPAGLLSAVSAAGGLARSTGALAFVQQAATVLTRP